MQFNTDSIQFESCKFDFSLNFIFPVLLTETTATADNFIITSLNLTLKKKSTLQGFFFFASLCYQAFDCQSMSQW